MAKTRKKTINRNTYTVTVLIELRDFIKTKTNVGGKKTQQPAQFLHERLYTHDPDYREFINQISKQNETKQAKGVNPEKTERGGNQVD